ncbi:PAS domain-containing protein [Glaciecola sp. SC05]|uniref:PAS domain-containing protein n=1 Tax=Glaciecola sp. SC05 TaxID=1987355 RepID=UPI0035289211
MHMQTLLKHSYVHFLAICVLLANSTHAFAWGEYVKQQNVQQITTGLYILLGAIALLLLAAVSLFVMCRVNKHKHMQDTKHQAHMLNVLPVGFVHVDLSGKIIYANTAGASYLGRASEKLINSQFVACFDSTSAAEAQSILTDNKAKVRARATASNLHLVIQSSEIFTHTQTAYRVITLINNNTLQRELDETSKKGAYLNSLFTACEYGLVKLDVSEDTYTHDCLFDDLLQLGQIEEGQAVSGSASVSDFVKLIHNHDIGEWTKAISAASAKGLAKASFRMQLAASADNAIYVPVEISIVGDKEALSEQATEDEEQKFTRFTVLVKIALAAEKQATKIDTLNQQRTAMVNAIPHAAYAIDKQGNLLWSNTRFNALFSRLSANASCKNLFEASPFPAEIMQLHKNSSFLSNHTDETEFDYTTVQGEAISLKLDLGFYATTDRLNQQKEIGIVGVLQDLSEIKKIQNKLAQERERNLETNRELIEEQETLVRVGSELQQEKEHSSHLSALLEQEQTSLVQTSLALAQEQERMSNFLKLAPVAIATINADDEILSANRVMLERLQYTEKELKKGNIYKLFSDPAEAGTTAKQLNKTGRLRDFHVKLKGKDGKIYPGELTVDVINQEKQEYLFWLIDRSDEQFQRDKFESLLQHSDMPMAILEDKGFGKLNQAACTFFAVHDEEDLFGQTPYCAELNQDEESALSLAQVVDDLKVKQAPTTIDWTHRAGGDLLPCKLTFVPIYKDHVFDCILCMWSDQSAAHKAEVAIAEAMAKRDEAQQQQKGIQEQLVQSQEQLTDSAQMLASTKQALQGVQEDLEYTKSEFAQLQKQYHERTQSLETLTHTLDLCSAELADTEQRSVALIAEYDAATQHIETLQAQRDELAHELALTKQACDAAQQTLASRDSDVDKVSELHQQQAHKLNELREQCDSMQEALRVKDEAIKSMTSELNDLHAQALNSQENSAYLEKQLIEQREHQQSLEQQKQDLEQCYKAAHQDMQQNAERMRQLQSELDRTDKTSNQEVSEAQMQHSQIKLELDAAQSDLAASQAALNLAHAAAAQLEAEKLAYLQTAAELEQELGELKSYSEKNESQLAQFAEQQNIHKQAIDDELATVQEQYVRAQESLKAAHQELAERSSQANADAKLIREDMERLPMPNNPKIWFDLVAYLQSQTQIESMQSGLKQLLDEIEVNIDDTEAALQHEQADSIKSSVEKLITLAQKVKSDPLLHLIQSIANDCKNGMLDNVSIRWPAAKSGLQSTLRVVYSHLH